MHGGHEHLCAALKGSEFSLSHTVHVQIVGGIRSSMSYDILLIPYVGRRQTSVSRNGDYVPGGSAATSAIMPMIIGCPCLCGLPSPWYHHRRSFQCLYSVHRDESCCHLPELRPRRVTCRAACWPSRAWFQTPTHPLVSPASGRPTTDSDDLGNG